MTRKPEASGAEYFEGYEGDPTKVRFANFDVFRHDVTLIEGVKGPIINELSAIFDFEPEHGYWTSGALRELVGIIAKSKFLQDNIKGTIALMGLNGKETAIELVEKSEILNPVFRSILDPSEARPSVFDYAVVTGGVRNWMARRADLLLKSLDNGDASVNNILLAAGTRPMKPSEGPDVYEGDTEATYMQRVIAPKFEHTGIKLDLLTPDTSNGSEIANAVADKTIYQSNLLVVCNAGNWAQNGGQIARVLNDLSKVWVISDSINVAKNNEPTISHQNPFSGVGLIARELYAWARLRESLK